MSTKKADQQASPKKTHLKNSTAAAQRARLLERLQVGAVDTIEARRDLNVMMPAARIKELRDAGHPIQTQRITMTDDQGRTHAGVAKYYLSDMSTDSSGVHE